MLNQRQGTGFDQQNVLHQNPFPAFVSAVKYTHGRYLKPLSSFIKELSSKINNVLK